MQGPSKPGSEKTKMESPAASGVVVEQQDETHQAQAQSAPTHVPGGNTSSSAASPTGGAHTQATTQKQNVQRARRRCTVCADIVAAPQICRTCKGTVHRKCIVTRGAQAGNCTLCGTRKDTAYRPPSIPPSNADTTTKPRDVAAEMACHMPEQTAQDAIPERLNRQMAPDHTVNLNERVTDEQEEDTEEDLADAYAQMDGPLGDDWLAHVQAGFQQGQRQARPLTLMTGREMVDHIGDDQKRVLAELTEEGLHRTTRMAHEGALRLATQLPVALGHLPAGKALVLFYSKLRRERKWKYSTLAKNMATLGGRYDCCPCTGMRR